MTTLRLLTSQQMLAPNATIDDADGGEAAVFGVLLCSLGSAAGNSDDQSTTDGDG